MKRNLIVLLTILVCGLTACKPGQKKDGNMEKETKLKIETSAGDIIVKLYNETPKHRDNFIKLAEEGTYEGTLFHRVIKDFMILVCGLTACKPGQKKDGNMEKETKLKIETSAGDIIVKLYNETPKHRDNFIKLAEEGTYEGTLFHRVIKDFMIQAGDPESKNAPKGKMLGAGDVGYTVPAEFVYPKYFHKKGALSAARQGDNVNPKKESSGCQFYIVTGKVYNDSTLLGMEHQMNQARLNNAFNALAQKHMKEIYKMRKDGDQEGLMNLQDTLIAQAEAQVAGEPEFRFTPEQVKAYTTVGGTPHLDGEYTVFGEVVEGMDVVDKIQQVKTDRSDRPEEDVKIEKVTVID